MSDRIDITLSLPVNVIDDVRSLSHAMNLSTAITIYRCIAWGLFLLKKRAQGASVVLAFPDGSFENVVEVG